jgi:4-hydroxybenzoate polyprenyltransferase
MTPPPLKLRWTGVVLAYARERLTPGRLVPAVLLVVAATLAGRGWTGTASLAIDALLALALVISFRIVDDLMDREHDRAAHPDRVVVRAPSTDPLAVTSWVFAIVALWTLDDRQGLQSVALLLVYMAILAASYRQRKSRTAATDRILLLKYGVFTLALIGLPAALTPRALGSAAAAFAAACVYEWWHDPESPVFSFGGSR